MSHTALLHGSCRMCRAGPFGTQRPRVTSTRPSSRVVLARAEGGNPMATNPAMMEAMKKAMQDPKMQEQMRAMQEAMKRPEVQRQMAEMQAMMQNQQLMQRMAQLRDDPEFAEMFEDIKKNGMQSLMKYYNDPQWLAKLGSKLGDVGGAPGSAAAAAAAAAPAVAAPPAPPAEPEINNLRDAAKYGDEEAVEDFIAIGKDINEPDQQGRTPLHFACAFDRPNIVRMLVDEGANLEAKDSMDNTPLHYAAGYGRTGVVNMLLSAGSNKTVKNSTGKTPFDLAKIDPRNPVNADEALLAKLTP